MMKGRALLVERGRGEVVRRALVAVHALRTDLAIGHEGGRLAFPLRDNATVPPEWGKVAWREFEPRTAEGPAEFRELLDWPAELAALLPRSFDVVGDVVLVRLPPELESRRGEVGEALLEFVPGVRLVGLDRGVQGAERRRAVERIAGSGGWRTRHRENGLEFEVDLERAYFSPRLAGEHARLASEVGVGERVYDLCCGVGSFAVTLAREGRARTIVAVDANPAAIELLRATLARYPFGDRVEAVEARVEEFAPSAAPADRVVLNLPREGIKYASLVAPLLAPGGSLHFYEVVPRDEVARRGTVVERALSANGAWSVRSVRVVHPYSPSSDLVAVVASRRGG
jgi:tRNA (guanine37-N1)-methyltransferase